MQKTLIPQPATADQPRRADCENERAGTTFVFLFREPLSGWREAPAHPRRTQTDWALEVAGLLEGHYLDCEQEIVVLDNLKTTRWERSARRSSRAGRGT